MRRVAAAQLRELRIAPVWHSTCYLVMLMRWLVLGLVALAVACSSPSDPVGPGSPDSAPGGGGGPPGPESSARIDWRTPKTRLLAESIEYDVAGYTYRVPGDGVSVDGDPGSEEYATLEASWGGGGRVNIYFHSDGATWWAEEIRTDDRSVTEPDWIIYLGRALEAPIGEPFAGDLALATPPDAPIAGALRMTGLVVQSFIPPRCDGDGYSLVAPVFSIDVPAPPAFYRVFVDVLDPDCATVDDLSWLAFDWELDEPIAHVTEDGNFAELSALEPGETTLRVSATDATTGEPVASAAIPVVVVHL